MTDNLNELVQTNPTARIKIYPIGHRLQRAGDRRPLKFYVKKDLLRSYIVGSKEKEPVFMFAPESWIIADVESMEYRKPATLSIDCLEYTALVVFEKDLLVQNGRITCAMI